MYPIITIDGSSGSGKGTLAYRLAKILGFNLLDSGALYRIVGLLAYEQGLLTAKDVRTDNDALAQALATFTAGLQIDFVVNDDTQAIDILLDGKPLQQDIRNETVGGHASVVASFAGVRAALLGLQRDMATRAGLVADGRDMGTVIFPKADAKIFLTANAAARATRRVAQLQQAGKHADFAVVLSDIQRRDNLDETRAVAPSCPASDALIIDSSHLSADEVYAQAWGFITQKLANFTNKG